MKTETAVKALLKNGHLWDMGQITKETRKKLLKIPGVNKKTAWWPWFHSGTCRKTVYTI